MVTLKTMPKENQVYHLNLFKSKKKTFKLKFYLPSWYSINVTKKRRKNNNNCVYLINKKFTW